VENSAAATAAQARIVSRRADDLLTLEGSCTTPTTPTRSTSR
jgi:hypothetical protein